MNNAVKATTHFYFAQAVLSVATSNEVSVSEIFEIAEDDFLMTLYPYSNTIQRVINDGEDVDESILYSTFIAEAEQLAECFWEIIERDTKEQTDCVMPDMDEFTLDVKRVLSPVTAR